nr:MAG TPA: hypothetical protein [Caudoviricetes sp.]
MQLDSLFLQPRRKLTYNFILCLKYSRIRFNCQAQKKWVLFVGFLRMDERRRKMVKIIEIMIIILELLLAIIK